jgi:hypothetical protein
MPQFSQNEPPAHAIFAAGFASLLPLLVSASGHSYFRLRLQFLKFDIGVSCAADAVTDTRFNAGPALTPAAVRP